MISNANVTHDDYQRILGPYPYDPPLGFCWFPNKWKLKRIESTPTNVSFEQLFLNKVKPTQEKKKKNRMKLDLRPKVENPNILLYVQPHPQGIFPFWYWKTRSFLSSDIRKAKCPAEKVTVYMYKQYMYTLKSRSEKNVWKKQLIEESDDDDEVISNVGGNNSTDDLS